jgi:hypothetical protein
MALDLGDVVHGSPAGERNRKVISQRARFAALVLQVVYEFGILAVFLVGLGGAKDGWWTYCL